MGNPLFSKMGNLSYNNTHFFSVVLDKAILILDEKECDQEIFLFSPELDLVLYIYIERESQCRRKMGKYQPWSHITLGLRPHSFASTHDLGRIV